ncbi:MAG: GntR family transcriptional regulator [Gammaproteobacteria bacterium]
MPRRTSKSFPVRATRSAVDPAGAALAQMAYRHLMQQLLEGDLAPGARLSVVELAAELACSRVPVMEALKRLDAEGFVEIVPQVGCRVATPRPDEVRDFFEMFAAVEGCVTRFAAQRRTAADLVEFRKLCADIDRALRRAGGPDSRDPVYRRLNLDFHTALHRYARAPLACAVAAGLWDRSDFFIRLAFGSLYFDRRVKAAHAEIRRAVVAGDGEAAQVAVAAHLRAVGAAVAQRLAAGAQPPR